MRAAGIIGADVFTGKRVRHRVLPMKKKAWAARFEKYAVLAGVNEPKKGCHGARKARAEIAAYADCTEPDDATREKLGKSGMEKIVAFD